MRRRVHKLRGKIGFPFRWFRRAQRRAAVLLWDTFTTAVGGTLDGTAAEPTGLRHEADSNGWLAISTPGQVTGTIGSKGSADLYLSADGDLINIRNGDVAFADLDLDAVGVLTFGLATSLVSYGLSNSFHFTSQYPECRDEGGNTIMCGDTPLGRRKILIAHTAEGVFYLIDGKLQWMHDTLPVGGYPPNYSYLLPSRSLGQDNYLHMGWGGVIGTPLNVYEMGLTNLPSRGYPTWLAPSKMAAASQASLGANVVIPGAVDGVTKVTRVFEAGDVFQLRFRMQSATEFWAFEIDEGGIIKLVEYIGGSHLDHMLFVRPGLVFPGYAARIAVAVTNVGQDIRCMINGVTEILYQHSAPLVNVSGGLEVTHPVTDVRAWESDMTPYLPAGLY